MKKLIFTLIILGGLFVSESDAQLRFGAGADLWLEGDATLGLQGKALYGINDQIALNGSFTYYLSDLLDYSLDLGVQYALLESESFKLSPLAGLDFTRASAFGFGSTNTALQVGVLFEIPAGGMNIYLEPKLIIDSGSGLVISGGVLF